MGENFADALEAWARRSVATAQTGGETDQMKDIDIHAQIPECIPKWDPELIRRSANECRVGPILRGGPIVRNLDGKDAHYRGDLDSGEKMYRADKTDTERSTSSHIPMVHGKEVPSIIEGNPEIEDWSLRENYISSARQLVEERKKKYPPSIA